MTFSSVYEMFDPLTTVRKQRFWAWLSGDALPSTFSSGGTGTGAMNDAVEGGYRISSTTASGGYKNFGQGDIEQFSETGSVLIAIIRPNQITTCRLQGGLVSTMSSLADMAGTLHESTNTNYELRTANTSNTDVSTGLAIDTTIHVHKIECKAASIDLKIDGANLATSTTNLPNTPLQIGFEVYNNATTNDVTYDFTYVEAYNT